MGQPAFDLTEYTRRNRRHAELSLKDRAGLRLVKFLKLPMFAGISELQATILRADGSREELGVISRRVVTTAGVNYLASAFNGGTTPTNMKYHGYGTGTNAEAIGDTALQTEVETRDGTGAQSNPSANLYRTVGIPAAATAPRVITEHGIFSASTTGTLWDRSVFSAINLAIGDSIQFTYTLTLTAGG